MHKILKDESRQKIILLLNEKGNLSYTELQDNLKVVSTGLLNYHLKVLSDLLQKNENGKYVLSEKGKLAYRLLTEETQPFQDKKAIRSWIVLSLGSIIIAVLFGYFMNFSAEKLAVIIVILMLTFGFASYIRFKPSKSVNRGLFIGAGGFIIGLFFWAVIMGYANDSGLRREMVRSSGNTEFDFFVITSLIICWIIGGFIGELIGKRMKYRLSMARI